MASQRRVSLAAPARRGGGGHRGRSAVAEPSLAPGSMDRAGCRGGGPADHRYCPAGRAGPRVRYRGDRRRRPCWWPSASRTGGSDPRGSRPRCGSAGLPAASAEPAGVQTKGSRPFLAVTDDGRRLFIKALGSDQRDADLLYRAYRFARLRNVGDTWPAASVIRAVEHQALIAVMAERAGVLVPRVDRVIKAGGGTALLAMEQIEGSSLGLLPAQRISDDLLRSCGPTWTGCTAPGSPTGPCGRPT